METDIRKRKGGGDQTDNGIPSPLAARLNPAAADETDQTDMEDDAGDSKSLPQATDDVVEVLDTALKNFTPRWRNYLVRLILTFFMIFSFFGVIYLGPIALIVLVTLIQVKCYHEIITIGHIVYKSQHLPWFRTLSWYFLVASNYFFYSESIVQYFGELLSKQDFLRPFVMYHRFISFSLYIAGFVGFVFSLKKKHYLKQFSLFGWTHITLLILVTQSHLIMQNIFEGMIWFILPVTIIICNDIWAYLFGFFFGKTPLIKLSPKKTWEGFIGGAFATIIWGLLASYVLVQYDFFVCPIEYNETKEMLSNECDRDYVFQVVEYAAPKFVQQIGAVVGREWKTIHLYPIVLHSMSMSLFGSLIGPFGGFFASGFKRAFKIKDFGATIPGHGGFMDRFDCQLLMATFIHVYMSSFIKSVSPQKHVQHIISLRPDEQLQIFNMLKESLLKRGLLALD